MTSSRIVSMVGCLGLFVSACAADRSAGEPDVAPVVHDAPAERAEPTTVPPPPSPSPSAAPVESVVEPAAGVEQRIVPVDGDLAEIVFALGHGGEVVATDISATYPAEADALPEIGYQRALSAEPIAAFEPTLVLATDLAGPADTMSALDRLGIRTVVIERDSTADGPGDKIRAVATAIGAESMGEQLASDVDAQIGRAVERASAAPTAPRVGVLYLRGENVQLLLGEGSGVDWIIDAVGAVDIADELGIVDNAPISTESLVLAAPDVLIVPERGLESVGGIDGLLAVPGVAETPAGRDLRILTYDDQLLLGNGPRTGELLDQLTTDLHGDL